MGRIYFSKGLKGSIASHIQADLLRQHFFAGSADKFVDGDFGGHTETALQAFQHARDLPVSGAIDLATWQQLTTDPLPGLFDRCLSLTAAFEGHGYGLIQGNFDGAGLTWGIIGFTLSSGEIQAILAEAEQQSPSILDRCLGECAAMWRDIVKQPRAQQLQWADKLSLGAGKLALPGPWLTGFASLGDDPVVQRIQKERALHRYFEPALVSAKSMRLKTELGIALAFDVHVQNGGFKDNAKARAAELDASVPEARRREILANAVADAAASKWQDDVRTRKLAVAKGAGLVHGAPYALKAWGLDDILVT
jgi:hypothetical protein